MTKKTTIVVIGGLRVKATPLFKAALSVPSFFFLIMVCPKNLCTKVSDKMANAHSVYPDQKQCDQSLHRVPLL